MCLSMFLFQILNNSGKVIHYTVMTNKSVELEHLMRILNFENNDDDPLLFIISPDLPDWVSKIALC